MIERHYFRNRLLKSYDFTFGFCIPGSINTWEAIYGVPPLDEDVLRDMIAHPFDTVSDSFFFVGNELIMHTKARYRYTEEGRDGDGALELEHLSLVEREASMEVDDVSLAERDASSLV